MATRRPAEAFSPGDMLREELEVRGWTQADLASIIDRPVSMINEIVTGKRGITAETAHGLAAALGIDAEMWMALDASFQLSKVEDRKSETIERRAKLFEKAPLKEMIRRGWIEDSSNVSILETQIKKFYSLASIDDEPEMFLHAARKSSSYQGTISSTQMAWLFRARHLAKSVEVDAYHPESLPETLSQLRKLIVSPSDVNNVPRVLAEGGIRLVVVQALQGSKIDGACFWINENPTIALSNRFDRVDNFWFVLMHELGHVSQGEASFDLELDMSDVSSPGIDDAERMANDFAIMNLVPRHFLDNFIAKARPRYTAGKVVAFATECGVHPGIVVGQLQHRGELAYSSLRKFLVPVRERLIQGAVVDGWGHVPT